MRCQTFNAPLGVEPVFAPSRGCANHHFSGGYDLFYSRRKKNVPVVQLSLFLCVRKNIVEAEYPCASCRGRENRGLELQHLVSPSVIEAPRQLFAMLLRGFARHIRITLHKIANAVNMAAEPSCALFVHQFWEFPV